MRKRLHIFQDSIVLFLGEGIKCLSCGREEGVECSEQHVGKEVYCQMESPEEENFGDACYVGHDGKISLFSFVFLSMPQVVMLQ